MGRDNLTVADVDRLDWEPFYKWLLKKIREDISDWTSQTIFRIKQEISKILEWSFIVFLITCLASVIGFLIGGKWLGIVIVISGVLCVLSAFAIYVEDNFQEYKDDIYRCKYGSNKDYNKYRREEY